MGLEMHFLVMLFFDCMMMIMVLICWFHWCRRTAGHQRHLAICESLGSAVEGQHSHCDWSPAACCSDGGQRVLRQMGSVVRTPPSHQRSGSRTVVPAPVHISSVTSMPINDKNHLCIVLICYDLCWEYLSGSVGHCCSSEELFLFQGVFAPGRGHLL